MSTKKVLYHWSVLYNFEGFELNGFIQKENQFVYVKTSLVSKRISKSVIETLDGILYKLQGNFIVSKTNLPSDLYNAFEQGLPVEWKNILAKLIKPINTNIPSKQKKNEDSFSKKNYKNNENDGENKINGINQKLQIESGENCKLPLDLNLNVENLPLDPIHWISKTNKNPQKSFSIKNKKNKLPSLTSTKVLPFIQSKNNAKKRNYSLISKNINDNECFSSDPLILSKGKETISLTELNQAKHSFQLMMLNVDAIIATPVEIKDFKGFNKTRFKVSIKLDLLKNKSFFNKNCILPSNRTSINESCLEKNKNIINDCAKSKSHLHDAIKTPKIGKTFDKKDDIVQVKRLKTQIPSDIDINLQTPQHKQLVDKDSVNQSKNKTPANRVKPKTNPEVRPVRRKLLLTPKSSKSTSVDKKQMKLNSKNKKDEAVPRELNSTLSSIAFLEAAKSIPDFKFGFCESTPLKPKKSNTRKSLFETKLLQRRVNKDTSKIVENESSDKCPKKLSHNFKDNQSQNNVTENKTCGKNKVKSLKTSNNTTKRISSLDNLISIKNLSSDIKSKGSKTRIHHNSIRNNLNQQNKVKEQSLVKARKRKGENDNEKNLSTSEINCLSVEIEKPESGFLNNNKKSDKSKLLQVEKKRYSNIQNDLLSKKDEPCDKVSKTVTPFIANTIITRSKAANQKNNSKNKTISKPYKNTQNKVKASTKQKRKCLHDNFEKLNDVSEWVNSGVRVKSGKLKEKNIPTTLLNSKTKSDAKLLKKKMSAQNNSNQLGKTNKMIRGKRNIKEIKDKVPILSGQVLDKLKTKGDQVQQDIFGVSLHYMIILSIL